MSAIILASTSPYRKMLLERLGLEFEAMAPDCDEDALKGLVDDPLELAERLAAAKASSIAVAHPEAIVIGSDQVADHAGTILGKPGSSERACAQLGAMSGDSHRLITAMCIQHQGRSIAHTDITTLHMRQLSAAAIARYVAADQPLDCAGAYKLEQRGISLFDRIESNDHSAITGLPLIALCTTLRDLGVEIP
ncbi:MAG: Maf family protein [Planctomycetota bacterium]|jgi:septum formation protein|nr:Maf family protein [Planctomycetota bacterium]